MPTNPNPRRTNGWRRDQVRARVLAEEHDCAGCGKPVDKTLSTRPDGKPHPMAPVVDEIVPVSTGGSPYDRTNCQLMHRICNARKGNRTGTPQAGTAEPVLLLPLSRSW